MANRIVTPALTPSIPTGELATLAAGYFGSIGKFFDMVRQEISVANSTDFDGVEFLVKGASAETDLFADAISKMTIEHVGGEGPQEGNEVASTTAVKLSESDLERIAQDISEVTCLINSIRNLAKEITEVDVAGIEALCEKAGFMSDRCAEALGEPSFCGSLEKWARLEWPEAQVVQ